MIGKITLFVIENVNPEWIVIKQLVEERNRSDYELFIGLCNCEIFIKYFLLCRHLLFRACNEGFFISLSLFYPRWWINEVFTLREWTPCYYDETLNSYDQDPSTFRDKGKNRYLEVVAQLNDLYIKLFRQQTDQLINQLITFQVNVVNSHKTIQKNLQSISTELSASSFIKQTGWFVL